MSGVRSLADLGDRSEPGGGARTDFPDFEAHSGPMQREIGEIWSALPAGAVDQPQVRQAPRPAGLILAGGRGRRVGGRDKGLMPYHGRPLVAWMLERLAPQVDEICISANRNLDAYHRYGHPVLPDSLPEYPGPLAGLREGLAAVAADWLLAVPCDVPHLPLDCAQRLLAAATAQERCAAYPRAGGADHYAVLLLHKRCAGALEAYLRAGGRSVRGLLDVVGAAAVEFEAAEGFANLNTLQDFEAPPP